MKFGSLFSGIGGFDLAFERAGMECVWQCEIDKAAQSVLKKHFGKEIFEDVRNLTGAEPVDLICGGFPCQDLSVAGKRKGLAGERSGLWFEFARVIDEFEPKWVVIENVAGLLSSDKGRDFAVILRWLVERGYGVSWRVLDAQNFGLAQRRKRVFIVGSFGNGRSAEVLFEREGLRRDTPKGRKEGEEVAGTLDAKSASSNRGSQANETEFIVANTIQGRMYKGENADSLNLVPNWVAYENHPNDSRVTETGDITQQLTSRMGTGGRNVPLVMSSGQANAEITQDLSPTLSLLHEQPILNGVLRLTPTECERLQGFPDGWTDGQSDSNRYKQLGNAVAVPVAKWIGRRIIDANN